MAELREVAEAIVAEARRTYPLCPFSYGCDYCEQFGCPQAFAEIVDAYPHHFDLSVEDHDGVTRYFLRRLV